MLFELFCYTVAIVGTFAFFGNPTPATVAQPETITEAPQPEPEDLFEALPILADLLIEVEAARVEPEPIAQPAPAMAQVITEAVTLTIPTEGSTDTEGTADLASLKTPQLRKMCSQRGIVWRNALGQNRHLSKAAMVAALVS